MKFTDLEPAFYDVALVEIDPADTHRVTNRSYGSNVQVVQPADAQPQSAVSLHAARTAVPEERLGRVAATYVFGIPEIETQLPGGRYWVRLSLPAAKGDSGGLVSADAGRSAVGILQVGRLLDDGSENYLITYATPFTQALSDLERGGQYVRFLPGYAALRLSLL